MTCVQALAAALILTAAASQAEARCADVAVVLALDASGSISGAEFHVQTAGYYAALNHPDVHAAMNAAGTVDLAALFWADGTVKPQIIGWHRIERGVDARNFAKRLINTTRLVSGSTDIGVGINAAMDLLEEPGRCADRAVIDISGDGRATAMGRRHLHALAPARRRALDGGVVINALAITIDDPRLGEYYTEHVAGGIGSFVMEANSFEAFQIAMTQKLARELLAQLVNGGPDRPSQPIPPGP